jgi:hypothetical protein
MKLLSPIACIIAVAFISSCQSSKESSTGADATVVHDSVPAPTVSDKAVPFVSDIEMNISHDGSKVEIKQGTKLILSFNLPDSATWDFENEGMGYIGGKWDPGSVLEHKGLQVSVEKSPCYYPSDEGTSTEQREPVMGERQFDHGSFDNRAAGTDGIEEMYDVMINSNCIRFTWVLNWGYGVNDEQQVAEFAKIEAFLKSVHFEE